MPLQILLVLYRGVASPLLGALGARCRYHPSCSRYAQQALARHGWRGIGLAARRVLRCHPWSPGGVDPVP